MNNGMELVFAKVKSCYGRYEMFDISWHCKGCPIANECKRKRQENRCNEQSK